MSENGVGCAPNRNGARPYGLQVPYGYGLAVTVTVIRYSESSRFGAAYGTAEYGIGSV